MRKETRWLTNPRCIAEELEGVCEVGKFIGVFMWWAVDELRQHRFTFKELVEAILRGSRRELQETGEISAVVGQLTGPTDEYDEQEELYKKEFGQFWVDDVTGTELLAHLVKMARKEELDWLRKEGIYDKVSRSS